MAVKKLAKTQAPHVTSKATTLEFQKAVGVQQAVTLVRKTKTAKAEEVFVSSNAMSFDDDFEDLYFDPNKQSDNHVLRPPFILSQLALYIQTNNALEPCIAAMEVNIDGTGCIIDKGNEKMTPTEEKEAMDIKEFFNEVYPNTSMVSLRRSLRRNLETIGNGYIEILRSLAGKIIFLNWIDAVHMRIVKLDDAIPVNKEILRNGEEHQITVMMRERRFVQHVGTRLVYFKAYGSSRELNKETGKWAEAGTKLSSSVRATEILHFIVNKDVRTAYGVPRWISQIPSVLGSRKAEELNLDFFNAGGLPPVLIIVQGGSMTESVRKNLQTYLSGKGASKHRAAILETFASGGSLDSTGSVKVTVERFGAERQKDSMFEGYDARCEQRIRSSFRLPPLFVGRAEAYNYATALASYIVAEAQVFRVERDEFDEVMNVTIMTEIGKGYKFRSKALNIKDTDTQLKGIEMAQSVTDPDSLLDVINEVTNLSLKSGHNLTVGQTGNAMATPPIVINGSPSNVNMEPDLLQKTQKLDPLFLTELARDWAAYTFGEQTFKPESVTAMNKLISVLSKSDRMLFERYVAMRSLSGLDYDPEGGAELCGCVIDIFNATNETEIPSE